MKGKKKTPYDIYIERSSQPDYRPLASIADSFVVFVVLLEDCAFFKHKRGYDLKLIWLAIKNYLRGWGTFGGSTITQQLVKNLYFTFEKRIARKIRKLFHIPRAELILPPELAVEILQHGPDCLDEDLCRAVPA